MKIQRRALLSVLSATAASALIALPGSVAAAKEPIRVVASFSILGDMVKRIGGEHVRVTTLVGPDNDAHVYQPTPADARSVSQARILIANGLKFEGWLDRLVKASGFKGVRVVATKGIKAIPMDDDDDHDHDKKGDHKAKDHDHDHDKNEKKDAHKGGHHHHGEFDPHGWQSLKNAVIYVNNITTALSKASPEHAKTFRRNRDKYVGEIRALDKEISAAVSKLPKGRRTIVTSHDAFQYFGRAYGLKFVAPQGISTESKPSAKEVAQLITFMKKNKIRAVFVENITDTRLLKQIANETGATIGGTLYPDGLSGPKGPASTYLKMMRHNATTITAALSS